MEKNSKQLASYLRKILKQVLVQKDFNYFSKYEEIGVQEKFKKIGISQSRNAYNNLKQENRLNGIKKISKIFTSSIHCYNLKRKLRVELLIFNFGPTK